MSEYKINLDKAFTGLPIGTTVYLCASCGEPLLPGQEFQDEVGFSYCNVACFNNFYKLAGAQFGD